MSEPTPVDFLAPPQDAQLHRRRTEKTSERLARQIVRYIGQRQLEPGATLPSEAVLLAQLEVGKSSLRAALRLLELNGVLKVKSGPSGGPVVTVPGSRELGQMVSLHLSAHGMTFRQLLRARVTLEPVLAGLAARQTDEAVLTVSDAQDRALGVREESATTFEPVATDYHSAIFDAAGNPVMADLASAYRDVWISKVAASQFPRDDRAEILEEHDAITKAILNHDEREAKALMRAHLEGYAAYCEQWYSGRLDDVVDWR